MKSKSIFFSFTTVVIGCLVADAFLFPPKRSAASNRYSSPLTFSEAKRPNSFPWCRNGMEDSVSTLKLQAQTDERQSSIEEKIKGEQAENIEGDRKEYLVKQEVYLPGLLPEEQMFLEEEGNEMNDQDNVLKSPSDVSSSSTSLEETTKNGDKSSNAQTKDIKIAGKDEQMSGRKYKDKKRLSDFNFFARVSEDKIQFPCQRKLNEFCNFVINRILLVSQCDGYLDKVLIETKRSLNDCWTTGLTSEGGKNKETSNIEGTEAAMDHAMNFLDAVAALSVCSNLSADETRNKIQDKYPYNVVYTQVLDMLQNANCEYQNIMDGKLIPKDKEICLSLMDSISDNTRMTRTKILNQLSNRVLRTLVYGTNEDCQRLSDELKENKENYLNASITQCPIETEQNTNESQDNETGILKQEEGKSEVKMDKCPVDHNALLEQGITEEEIRSQLSNLSPPSLVSKSSLVSSTSISMKTKPSMSLTPNPGESMYYDALVAHTKSGMEARIPGLSGSYANAYQRLLTLIVQEIGTRVGPINDDFYESFVSWESGLRKNLTEPFWNPLPTELTGVWFLEEDFNMYKDGRRRSSKNDVGPRTRKQVANRLPTKEELNEETAEDGQSLSLYDGIPVVFRKDGSMQVDPEVGLGGTWRLEPGPTHLDTIFFSIIPAGRPSSVLQYQGYIDRGQRIECRFSKRPIRMMGRVNYLVRGEVKNLARFCMRKDYLSRAFYPTQSSSVGNLSVNISADEEGQSENIKRKNIVNSDDQEDDDDDSIGAVPGKKGMENASSPSQDRELQENKFASSHSFSNDINKKGKGFSFLIPADISLDALLRIKRFSMTLKHTMNSHIESFLGSLDEQIEAVGHRASNSY